MKTLFLKFLASPLGTWMKTFIAILVVAYLRQVEAAQTIITFDRAGLYRFIAAGLISMLPVILNWFNAHYPGYGITLQNQGK